jgi:hypothetical protein
MGAVATVNTDPNLNPVKNKLVTFQGEDILGGGVSPESAITDSNGVARTIYTAGITISNNILVTASVIDGGIIVATDSAVFTGAGQEFCFDIGMGKSIEELSQTP